MSKEVRVRKEGPTFPKSIHVFLYPETDGGGFVAQCLELDLIGMDKSVQGALQELLEVIDVQFESCKKTGASFLFRSPKADWLRYNQAKSGGHVVPLELIDRVFEEVNLVNLHIKFEVSAYASSRVPKKCLQLST